MKKFFIEKDDIDKQKIIIRNNEFLHLKKVLRLNVGDKIICLSGDKFEYFCEIIEIFRTYAEARILEKQENLKNPTVCIDVFLGVPKGEKLSFIVQKLNELGISNLTLFESDFTIAKINPSKIERLSLISKESCKQCGRSKPLKISPLIKLKNIENFIKEYDIALFAYENAEKKNAIVNMLEKIKKNRKIAIIIGAEGGFSKEEYEKLKKLRVCEVFLGSRILKVETAVVALSAFLSFIMEN